MIDGGMQRKPAIFALSRACIARGTGSSNPFPSREESANFRFLRTQRLTRAEREASPHRAGRLGGRDRRRADRVPGAAERRVLPHTGRSSAPAESARDGEIDPGRVRRCLRAPIPVKVGAYTSCPALRSFGASSRQTTLPAKEPCTRTNVAIASSLLKTACYWLMSRLKSQSHVCRHWHVGARLASIAPEGAFVPAHRLSSAGRLMAPGTPATPATIWRARRRWRNGRDRCRARNSAPRPRLRSAP